MQKKKHNKQFLGLFSMRAVFLAVALLTVALLGSLFILSCEEEPQGRLGLPEEVPKIAGAFTYNDININQGIKISKSPTWKNETSGQKVEYTIAPALPTGFEIDTESGKVTVLDTSTPLAETTYTVSATGTGDFEGSATSTIKIQVNVATLIDGTLKYEDSITELGKSSIVNPAWTAVTNAAQMILYSISKTVDGKGIEGIGVSINGGIEIADTTKALEETEFEVKVVGTGAFGGTIKTLVKITVRTLDLGGFDLVYADTTVLKASTIEISPTTTIPDAAKALYSVAPALPTGIVLNPNTGMIRVETTAEAQAVAEYTITARPTVEKYTGIKQAKAKIGVLASIDINTLDLEYEDLTVEQGEEGEVSPTGTIPPAATVGYALKIGTWPTGITFEAATGKISVGTTAVAQTKKEYTIVATPTATGYRGEKEAKVNIAVGGKDISVYNFLYEDTIVSTGTAGEVSPTGDIPSGADVNYTLKTGTWHTGITLEEATGKISIGATAAELTEREYTILARASGTNGYSGEKETTVKITISSNNIAGFTFTYAPKSIPKGTATDITPTQTFPDLANVSYALKQGSILPGGMTLKRDTGAISIADNVVLQAETPYTIVATPGVASGYTGEKEAIALIAITSNDVSALDFEYADTSVVFGTAKEVGPTHLFPRSAAISFVITGGLPVPTGITVSLLTGDVDIKNTTAVMAEAEYTITATPEGVGFVGTKEAKIKIVITPLSIVANDFSYTDTSATFGTASSVTPSQNFDAATGVKYTIKTGTGESVFPVDGSISLDADSGKISISATAVVQAVATYTIVATPTAAGYEGTKEATIKIAIKQKNIGIYTLTYAKTSVIRGDGEGVSPSTNILASTLVNYSVNDATPLPTGVSININTGEISVDILAPAIASKTYIIKAIPTDTNFTGSIVTTLVLKITDLAGLRFVEARSEGGLIHLRDVSISPDGKNIYTASTGAATAVAVFNQNIDTEGLTYSTNFSNGTDGVDGINGAFSIEISPDGKNAYTASVKDDAVVTFNRDVDTGALTYVNMIKDGVDGVDGLNAANWIEISPDGKNVYATGGLDDALVTFNRNTTTGALTYVSMFKDGVDGVDGLNGPVSVRVSPDGKHVYVTVIHDDSVVTFNRNTNTGALTFGTSVKDGVDGVDGLDGPSELIVSPDGKNVYATGSIDDALAVFTRNTNTGALTFVEMFKDGVGGVDGLDGADSVTVSPDGQSVYATGLTDNSLVIFNRNRNTGALTFVKTIKDGVDGVDGLAAANSVTVSPDGKFLFVTGRSDAAIAVFKR